MTEPERLKGLYRAATAPQQAISLQDKVFGIMGKLVNLWHIRFSWMTHFMIFIQIVPARNFKIRIKREHRLIYIFMFLFRAMLYAITLTRSSKKWFRWTTASPIWSRFLLKGDRWNTSLNVRVDVGMWPALYVPDRMDPLKLRYQRRLKATWWSIGQRWEVGHVFFILWSR